MEEVKVVKVNETIGSTNKHLNVAAIVKNDEFYTSYVAVEEELKWYIPFFENKTIYLNCDYYAESNFWKYFFNNFQLFKLKKLICSNKGVFYENQNWPDSVVFTNNGVDVNFNLLQNGSYDSPELTPFVEECDIIITNPPFSIFLNYIDFVFKSKKQFIILSHLLTPSKMSVFAKFKTGECFPGVNLRSRSQPFNGLCNKPASNVPVYWITNIPHNIKVERESSVPLIEYADQDNVLIYNKLIAIPPTGTGLFLAPVTLLWKYNFLKDKIDFIEIAAPTVNGKKSLKGFYVNENKHK